MEVWHHRLHFPDGGTDAALQDVVVVQQLRRTELKLTSFKSLAGDLPRD